MPAAPTGGTLPQPGPDPVLEPTRDDFTTPLAIVDTRAGMRWGLAHRPRYNPDDLAGRKGLRIYDDMMRDEQVKACLGLKVAAIIGPGWTLEPGDETEQAEACAELVEQDLRNLPGPVEDILEGVLSALGYGFSLTEQVWTLDGGRLRLERLQPIAPHDITFIQDPWGRIEAIRQLSSGTVEPMPPGKFVHYVNGAFANFANPFGTSDLRAAYGAWFMKQHVTQCLGIYTEKLADAPIVSRHPRDTPPSKITAAQQVLENLQARTVLSVPEGWEVELLGTGQRQPRSTFLETLDHLGLAIAKALLIPDKLGIVGGAVQAGSLALSKSQLGVFFLVIELNQRRLEACINEQLVKRMAQFAMPTAPVPRFRLMPIAQDDRLAIVQAWNTLVAGGMPQTAEDMNHSRKLLDYPEVEDAALEAMIAERDAKAEAMAQRVATPPAGNGKRKSAEDEVGDDEAKLAYEPKRHPKGAGDVVGDSERDGGKFAPKGGDALPSPELMPPYLRDAITDPGASPRIIQHMLEQEGFGPDGPPLEYPPRAATSKSQSQEPATLAVMTEIAQRYGVGVPTVRMLEMVQFGRDRYRGEVKPITPGMERLLVSMGLGKYVTDASGKTFVLTDAAQPILSALLRERADRGGFRATQRQHDDDEAELVARLRAIPLEQVPVELRAQHEALLTVFAYEPKRHPAGTGDVVGGPERDGGKFAPTGDGGTFASVVYRGEPWSGGGLSAHGIGTYYGLDEKSAAPFVKPGTIRAHSVALQNAITIRNDGDLKRLKQRAEAATGLDFGRVGNLYEMLRPDQSRAFTEWMIEQDYDGLVIDYKEAAGGRQVVVFPKKGELR